MAWCRYNNGNEQFDSTLKAQKTKGYSQFEITLNVRVVSFCFFWIPLLWVYGHHKYFTLSVRYRLSKRQRWTHNLILGLACAAQASGHVVLNVTSMDMKFRHSLSQYKNSEPRFSIAKPVCLWRNSRSSGHLPAASERRALRTTRTIVPTCRVVVKEIVTPRHTVISTKTVF